MTISEVHGKLTDVEARIAGDMRPNVRTSPASRRSPLPGVGRIKADPALHDIRAPRDPSGMTETLARVSRSEVVHETMFLLLRWCR